MNEKELRKKLSILKSAPVPKGYWTGYWPRLKQRTEQAGGRAAEPRQAPRPLIDFSFPGVLVPALAMAAVAVGFYRLGFHAGVQPMTDSPDIHLASGTSETQAQRVFREMLQLFPNRVNWISFMDGKVDFSISSVAYPDSKTLIPLVFTLPRAKDPFEARILIRPGQAAGVEGTWDKSTSASLHVQLTPDGRKASVSCRLNGSVLETEVDISKEGTQPLGSFRVSERLVQAQLTRLRQGSGGLARPSFSDGGQARNP